MADEKVIPTVTMNEDAAALAAGVAQLVHQYLSGTDQLKILPPNELHLAINTFVEKEDGAAISEYATFSIVILSLRRFVENTLKMAQSFLQEKVPSATDSDEISRVLTAFSKQAFETAQSLVRDKPASYQDEEQDIFKTLAKVQAQQQVPSQSRKRPKPAEPDVDVHNVHIQLFTFFNFFF